MKIGILGAEGLLGSSLMTQCKKKGFEVSGASRQQANIADLESLDNWICKELPTHIINCAAYTHVDHAEKDSALAFAVNAQGPANLGHLAKKMGIRVLHISTDYVFDGEKNSPYLESDRCNPQNVYGVTKWQGELKLLDVYPEACVLRTSWLFGKKGKNFISSVWQKMQEQETLKIISDQKGCPTFADDLADVLFLMLDQSGIFHFANADVVSRFQMAEDLYEEMKLRKISFRCSEILPVSSEEFPMAAKRPLYSVLDTHKIQGVMGHSSRGWKSILKDYLECISKEK